MYLFNKADGYQTEGIGAVAQCQIHTYTLSRMLGVEFASTKFENLQHYQEHSTQVEFCQDVTKFFNFPKGQLNSDNVVSFEKIDEEFIKFVEENRNEKDLYVEVGRADMMRTADIKNGIHLSKIFLL